MFFFVFFFAAEKTIQLTFTKKNAFCCVGICKNPWFECLKARSVYYTLMYLQEDFILLGGKFV